MEQNEPNKMDETEQLGLVRFGSDNFESTHTQEKEGKRERGEMLLHRLIYPGSSLYIFN